jgi:C1A family cysteine protease
MWSNDKMEEDEEIYQFGWVPDYPDFRDYTEEDEGVKLLLEKTSVMPIEQAAGIRLPASVDLRKWCSPIEDQGGIGSCTANAGAGVIEL